MRPESLDSLVAHARAQGAISTDEAMRLLGASRATAQPRLRTLVADGRLVREGAGRGAGYALSKTRWERPLAGLEEDRPWAEVRHALADLGLSERELGTVGYTFTAVVNNAIDQSRGLDKGRFITQPTRHSGEGIFSVSKAANRYLLASGKIAWLTDNEAHVTAIQIEPSPRSGTRVTLNFVPGKVCVMADVFQRWADPGTLAFDRMRTAVWLAGFGVQLLSRSEARRVTVGLERFRHVTIEFTGVDIVGQGFCDEVFRVFAAGHPQIVLATRRA